jgi:DNA-binding CsgD family transcriptional regulator
LTESDNAALVPPSAASDGDLPDDFEIGRLSPARLRVASEIGAAMAHELNGPLTALLLYIGDIQQNKDRLGDDTLKRAADGAFLEAERICALIHRMGDSFEAPIPESNAIGVARDAIAWWARTGQPESQPGGDAARRPAGEPRPGTKPLTPREQEVLRLVSEGYSNKQGALLMKISYRTFECHRAEVMRKFGARNAAELVRLSLLDTGADRISPECHSA